VLYHSGITTLPFWRHDSINPNSNNAQRFSPFRITSFMKISSHNHIRNTFLFLFHKMLLAVLLSAIALVSALAASPPVAEKSHTTTIRVVAYNVACGQWTTPEKIADVLKPLHPDLVLLSEVPKADRGKEVKDWSLRLAEALDLGHVYVGTISSANHKSPRWSDQTGNYGGKFKSILSRSPLSQGKDFLVKGTGWKRASAVRVETEIGGRKFAIYSLHLPGYAHHKTQPTSTTAWEGSKHKSLADQINAEAPSCDIIVGGDFNEWTDSVVMKSFQKECDLTNAIKDPSIDHILYSSAKSMTLLAASRDWGPKDQNDQNKKYEGALSDHPWVWCELEISSSNNTK